MVGAWPLGNMELDGHVLRFGRETTCPVRVGSLAVPFVPEANPMLVSVAATGVSCS